MPTPTCPPGTGAKNLRRAIACYKAALRVYTEADFPTDWAMTQNNLGAAYADLPTGDRGKNLRRAIACYKAALRVYTEANFPTKWAMIQNNLGIAYADFPTKWAMIQNNLGIDYADIKDREKSLRQAIACYEAALRVYTEADFPTKWAMIQNNLGIAYAELPADDRGTCLRQAIACYEAALRVYTEADFPTKWAMIQNNLSTAQVCLRRLDEIVQEVVHMVHDRIGPVANFKHAVIVERMPMTRSGKIMHRVLAALANRSDDVGDVTTLMNPEVIEYIRQMLSYNT